MTTTYNRFEEVVANKLGEIQKKNTAQPGHFESMMSSAIPIWTLLGITEEEYYKKYAPVPPVDISGTEVPVVETRKEDKLPGLDYDNTTREDV